MTKHPDSSRSTDSDSSAPNVPEMTRLSGEQAEERTAREGRLKAKYNCVYAAQDDFWMMTPLDKLDEKRFGTICLPVELYHAISECSRLASALARVHDSPHEPDKWELEVANAIGAKVPATLREEMERRAIKANESSRLASRVEELEKGLRELADEEEFPCFCDDHESGECCIQAGVPCTTCFAEKLLAGAHAEEKF